MTGSILRRAKWLAAAAGCLWIAAANAAAPTPAGTAVVLLGTRGGPVVDPTRSEPASLLVVDGVPYLIDAGEGAAKQIVAAGYKLPDIHQVFLTHHHLDHTAGLEPLMELTWINRGLAKDASPRIDVYGPPATAFLVDAALRYLSVSERIFRAGIPSLPQSTALFRAHDVPPGPVFSDPRVKVTAVANTHFGHPSSGPDGVRDASYAYRFDTAGGSVVFTGDTGPSDAVAKLATGADVLVSEVYMPRERPATGHGAAPAGLAEHMAQEHLTPAEVGKLAAQARVKRVVLTHISAGGAPDLEERLRAGVRQLFDGEIIVGRDLMRIDLAPAPSPGSSKP